jgi:hypothetical protein
LDKALQEFEFAHSIQSNTSSPFATTPSDNLQVSPTAQTEPPGATNESEMHKEYVTVLDEMLSLKIQEREASAPQTLLRSNMRYSGTSSTGLLVVKAIGLKKLYNVLPSSKDPVPLYYHIRPEMWRPEIWEKRSGEIQRRSPFVFPVPDLMSRVVELYFQEVNIYLPILHRPTFERAVQSQLHLRDDRFATVVMTVCAIGARWSEDQRVMSNEGKYTNYSKGWTWFNEAHVQRLAYGSMPDLYDLQISAVRFLFLTLFCALTCIRSSVPLS